MPYPDGTDFRAMDAATRAAPEPPAVRELDAHEIETIKRLRAVIVAIDAANWSACCHCVSRLSQEAESYLSSLVQDGAGYCRSLIAAIEAQPQDEADAEECIRLRWEAENGR